MLGVWSQFSAMSAAVGEAGLRQTYACAAAGDHDAAGERQEAARAAELKSDLNSAQIDARSLAEKSAQLQSDIQSKNQALEQESH